MGLRVLKINSNSTDINETLFHNLYITLIYVKFKREQGVNDTSRFYTRIIQGVFP